jgi:hypothetical protein
MSDFIEWRGLQLERRKEYPHERYDYVVEGGAFWIVERLDVSKRWIAWLIVGDRVRFMSPAETPNEALEGAYVDALKLDEQLRGAIAEVRNATFDRWLDRHSLDDTGYNDPEGHAA